MVDFANFEIQPVSMQVALNETAKFQCIVTEGAHSLQWLLNNVSVSTGNLVGVTEEETNSLDSSLCIIASTADSNGKVIYNNSNVTCVAINVNGAITGASATLQIQGNFNLIPSLVSHQCKSNCIFTT